MKTFMFGDKIKYKVSDGLRECLFCKGLGSKLYYVNGEKIPIKCKNCGGTGQIYLMHLRRYHEGTVLGVEIENSNNIFIVIRDDEDSNIISVRMEDICDE